MSFNPGNGTGGGGLGSVTSVSIVSANGFAGSILYPTTTPAITLSTSITGVLKGDGTSVSAVSASDITGQVLTGYTSGSGTVSATDSILQAIQKLNGNTALLTGAVVYQGTWNATTNTPTLTSGTGTKGSLYKVSVAGTTTLDGISSWNVGDSVVFDGTAWDKIDGLANEVISVAGRTGAVTLSQADISGLTTSSSPTFAGATLSGLTSGSILFAGASGVISQNNANLSWDNANTILAIGSASTATGYLRFYNGSTANTVSIKTGSTSGSYTLTLPTAVASAGQALIDAGGTGILSWGSFSPVAGSSSIVTVGTITSGIWNAGAITSSGAVQGTTGTFTAASSLTLGTASSAVGGIIFKNASNTNTLTIQTGATSTSYTLTMPLAVASAGQVLTDSAGNGILSWTTPSALSWGASISGNSGTGLTLSAGSFAQCISLTATYGTGLGILTSDLGGAGVNANFSHSSSGTLTAKTTSDVGFSTARNLSSNTTVTDNYVGFTFSRTNVTSGSAGTLNAQGAVVSIGATDTQNAGTLTPTYNLLQLNPTARCTGASMLITIPNSVASGVIGQSITIGNTQSNAVTGLSINTGTSSVGHTGISITMPNVASAVGISIAMTASTGSIMTASGTNIGSFSLMNGLAAADQTTSRIFFANIGNSQFSTGRSVSTGDMFYVNVNRTLASGTVTDNFYLAHFKRTDNVNSGTLTAQGSVMTIESVATSATTHTVNVLNLIQSSSITTGELISGIVGATERFRVAPMVANSGTNNAYLFDTTTSLSGTTTLGIFANAGTAKWTLDNAGNQTITGSITTAAPTTGTAAPWKLGTIVTGQVGLVLVATQYVQLDINGTLYRLATV